MLAWPSRCLLLSVAALASAHAGDLGGAGSVTVETNLARKTEVHDRIWSAVILATNVPAPKPIPPELREYEARLKRVFGYNQYELVGTSTVVIDEENEHWLVPSRKFSLLVKARRTVSREGHGGYLLNLQLFQDKRSLVETEAKVAPGSPLFFRGPACEQGQIIISLQVQH